MSTHPSLSPTVRARRERPTLVSLLLTTVPSVRMRRRDAARLASLLRRCEQALTFDPPRGVDLTSRLDRLHRAADLATQRPTRRALAIFVDAAWDHTELLPQPVFDRVVIDSHFDTRDLLFAEQFHPPFRMLVADGTGARIFESYEGTLLERDVIPIGLHPSTRDALLAEAVERLTAMNRSDPMPLVLATADIDLAVAVATHFDDYAGNIGWAEENRARLHQAARLRVSEWCANRARAEIPSDVDGWALGSEDVQRAVATDPAGTLLIEAHLHDGISRGIQVVDPSRFGREPSSVNAAIARVRSAGGHVRFVADGDLRDWGGVIYQRP